MNPIGFTAKINNVEQRHSYVKNIPETDKIITFDSGNHITFEDACHHILVLGTTGSGKTTSAILPMLEKLFRAMQGGLIIDIKGNLRNQVRALAKVLGREKDIVEFGTASTATSMNILRDLTITEVHDFFVTILRNLFEGKTGNLDFHMRGVTQATTCVEFLLILEQILGKKYLSLEFIGQFLDNPTIASKLYLAYKKILYNCQDNIQKDFVERIDASQISLFHYTNTEAHGRHYMEQLTYEISSARDSITNFIKTPGILHGFSNIDAPALNMSQYLKERKIIILRFGPDTGTTGVGLSRKLIQDYYQHIYDLGTEEAQKKPSFICLDEFQDVALLDGSRFSDSQFISQAREFKATFIASTQSVSALNCRNNLPNMVNSFVSNCNNRILFYSDDPATQELAKRSDLAPNLNTLQPGEAFIDTYCSENRTHNQSMETFNTVYNEIQEIVKKHPMKIAKTAKTHADRTTMNALLDRMSDIQKRKEVKAKKLLEQQEALKKQQLSSNSNTIFEVLEKHRISNEKSIDEQSLDEKDETVKSENTSELFETLCETNRLFKNYRHYFKDPSDMLIIPEGWTEFVCNVFDTLEENGMKPKIESVGISGSGILNMESNYRDDKNEYEYQRGALEEKMLNTLLYGSLHICPICGENNGKTSEERYVTSRLHICSKCLEKSLSNTSTSKKKQTTELGSTVQSNF